MARRLPSAGDTLDAWLETLRAHRYSIGLTEQMAVQQLRLNLISASGTKLTQSEFLSLIAPIVCISPESQLEYGRLLKEFLEGKPEVSWSSGPDGGKASSEASRARTNRWTAGFPLAVLILVLFGPFLQDRLVHGGGKKSVEKDPSTNVPIVIRTGKETNQGDVTFFPFTNRVVVTNIYYHFPVVEVVGKTPAKITAGTLGLASACALGVLLWGYFRRLPYLRSTRTSREVDERILYDSAATFSEGAFRSLRTSAVHLRRRISGIREVLDLPATIRQSCRSLGVLSPRFRRLRTTPEYLVLVDQSHRLDHFSHYALQLIRGLDKEGVVVHLAYFDGSPKWGCWSQPIQSATARPARRESLSELLARHSRCRLLVFAEATVAVDAAGDEPQSWMSDFDLFSERAWFTPLMPSGWGEAEDAIDKAGFLILPAVDDALPALADWLASGQSILASDRAWPGPYPSLLRQDPMGWAGRQMAPDSESVNTLLYQLRSYLGPVRFQWLCGCAIFPVLSPAMTMALGREVVTSEQPDGVRSRTLGFLALSVLPFFRYGRLPDWLRIRLLDSINRESERRFRKLMLERLDQALDNGVGEELVRVASNRRQAWFRRRRGTARDAVFVEFLTRASTNRLALRLPDTVRRLLFRRGMVAYGWRPWVGVGLAGVIALAGLTPWSWARYGPNRKVGETTTNSLGMQFVAIGPSNVLFSIWLTRWQDYAAYARENPGIDDSWRDPVYENVRVTPGPLHPVVNVSWEDAQAFCRWLTLKERREHRIHLDQSYRLPTDLEWSAAVGLHHETGATPNARDEKVPGVYPWGTNWPPPVGSGNFADETLHQSNPSLGYIKGYDDGFAETSPVGTYPALMNGLFDMSGNVWEWCEDWYDGEQKSRVLRGGSWNNFNPRDLLSSYRNYDSPGSRRNIIGFRVVLSGGGSGSPGGF